MALNTITQVRLINGQVIDLVDWTDLPLFSSADMQTGFTTQEISLFQYVEGDQVPGFGPGPTTSRTATENDTNIATPGSMASTEEMLVYAIKPEFYLYKTLELNNFNTRSYTENPSIPDTVSLPMMHAIGLEILNQQLKLQLIISQKEFTDAGIGYFNKGFGVQSFSLTGQAGSGGTGPGNNGLPSQEAVRSFVIPHHIGSQEKYRVNLVNASTIEDGQVQFGQIMSQDADPAGSNTILPDLMTTTRINLEGLYKRPTA